LTGASHLLIIAAHHCAVKEEKKMQLVDLDSLELIERTSELDPTIRVRVGFPHSSAVGTASTATVYFELEPGARLGLHQDSAEELLLVLEGEGEATVGEETGRAEAGSIVTVPAMVPHDIRNVGDGALRVLGFFSASTVVATFDEPPAPGGPQVFVIGAPIRVAVALPEPVTV
jgi:quercetin dioxygenase-like cupin family protein